MRLLNLKQGKQCCVAFIVSNIINKKRQNSTSQKLLKSKLNKKQEKMTLNYRWFNYQHNTNTQKKLLGSNSLYSMHHAVYIE